MVLEARDRLAGRTHGGQLANGTHIELGGQWVGPTHEAVLGLIDEVGLETHPTYGDGDAITFYDGVSHRYHDETFGLPEGTVEEFG